MIFAQKSKSVVTGQSGFSCALNNLIYRSQIEVRLNLKIIFMFFAKVPAQECGNDYAHEPDIHEP